MSKKIALRIMLVAGLLVVGLLVVLVFSTKSAPAANSYEASFEERLAESDNVFLNPPVPPTAVPDNFYTGSDFCERHSCQMIPATAVPDNYYTGSDYCERHSCEVIP